MRALLMGAAALSLLPGIGWSAENVAAKRATTCAEQWKALTAAGAAKGETQQRFMRSCVRGTGEARAPNSPAAPLGEPGRPAMTTCSDGTVRSAGACGGAARR